MSIQQQNWKEIHNSLQNHNQKPQEVVQTRVSDWKITISEESTQASIYKEITHISINIQGVTRTIKHRRMHQKNRGVTIGGLYREW